MGNTNHKKPKIVDDQPSYNFIDQIPDIYEQIFGYLDHESLLNALLVCNSWNEFIGQSSELMKKTKVKFRKTFYQTPPVCYQTIKAWKRKIIHLEVGYLLAPEECEIELLSENVSILKHLTSLYISANYLNSIKHILVTSLLLKNLKFVCVSSNAEDWNELEVGFEKINLKTLSILIWRKSFGVEKFLKTQAELEELELRGTYLNSASMKIITQMEQLKDLVLLCVDGEYDLNIVGNMPSLENFDANWKTSMNLELRTFDPIINSAPNLIKLDIKTLNQAWINSAGSKLKKLKKLYAFRTDFVNPSQKDLFPSLEELKIRSPIDYDLRQLLLPTIDDESTNFISCLHKELNNYQHKDYISPSFDDS